MDVQPGICDSLDFGDSTSPPDSSGGINCQPNINHVAASFPQLSVFLELLELANVTEIFLCAGPFTVLAPDNSAFQALDDDTFQQLLLPENMEKLQNLLFYHMIPGLVLADDFVAGPTQSLLVDETIDVSVNPLSFNMRAEPVQTDILACNGVIHIIDDVLVPGKCISIL